MKIIHVNQNVIRYNKKHKTKLPAVRVQDGSETTYCQEVFIHGPSRVVYRPNEPLPCGAQVWIETEANIVTAYTVPYSIIREEMEKL